MAGNAPSAWYRGDSGQHLRRLAGARGPRQHELPSMHFESRVAAGAALLERGDGDGCGSRSRLIDAPYSEARTAAGVLDEPGDGGSVRQQRDVDVAYFLRAAVAERDDRAVGGDDRGGGAALAGTVVHNLLGTLPPAGVEGGVADAHRSAVTSSVSFLRLERAAIEPP